MHEPFADTPGTPSGPYAAGTLFPTPSPAALNGGVGWNATGTATGNAAASQWNLANSGGAAAGTYRTATSPGLTYSATGYLPPTGNKLTLDATVANANQNVGRAFGGQVIDSGTTYFSFLISKNTPDSMRSINVAFFNGTSERFAIAQVGAAAGNSGGNLALYMNNSNPAGIVNSANPIAMGNGVTHLVLGKIEWNAAGFETVSMWVDPTDVTTEVAAGPVYASTSAFELTAITGVRPFVGNTVAAGANNPALPAVSANFDEIRIGGTWASVTSEAVAIPEPSAALLMVAGWLAGARRRRAG
ncbi:MAG TPA: hypothetical protein VEQ85_16575 [Lacipirellulaceae bacterium]|nr:hypothetical protein [Lacipirellulaceae bacterium]